jgi:hypothetical protein
MAHFASIKKPLGVKATRFFYSSITDDLFQAYSDNVRALYSTQCTEMLSIGFLILTGENYS